MTGTRRTRQTPRANSGEGRELGIDDRDIPGGLEHLVSPETPPTKPQVPAQRHLKDDVAHGVPVTDPDKPYAKPEAGKLQLPVFTRPPEEEIAVPVYQVERPGDARTIRTFISGGPVTLVPGEVKRIADRDPKRVKLYVTNESGTANYYIRVGSLEDADAGMGFGIPGARTIQEFTTQDELWVTNVSTASITISWGYETEVPVSGV
jgi:hypothetical protein